jgi:hypothetical protein
MRESDDSIPENEANGRLQTGPFRLKSTSLGHVVFAAAHYSEDCQIAIA